MSAVPHSQGWQARLELGFERKGNRTVLGHRRHQGPLVVQRPFYPEGAPCHLYLLHPPAGVVGGDSLTVSAAVAKDAHALVTTPGAAKFYRTHGPVARQHQLLRVARKGLLEWLPQETILFDRCDADLLTRVDLEADARFAGWEILCLGRPAGDAPFEQGRCRQRLEIWRDGQPLLIDRTLLEDDSGVLHRPWGLNGFQVTATFMVTPASEGQLNAAREALGNVDSEEVSAVTRINDVLVCRYLGHSAQRARACFTRVWDAVRPGLCDLGACEPRIWNT